VNDWKSVVLKRKATERSRKGLAMLMETIGNFRVARFLI